MMERQNKQEQKRGEKSYPKVCSLLEHSVNPSPKKETKMCIKCNIENAMSFTDTCFNCYIGVSDVTIKKKTM